MPKFNSLKIKDNAFIVFVILFSSGLRFINLSNKGVWIDEAYSVHLAHLSFIELIQKLSLESTPPFYYICLHFWINLFDFSEFSIRTLSVLYSLCGITSIYFLSKKYFSKQVACITACLIAISPIHIYYAQEARMYSLLAFLATLTMIYFLNYLIHKKSSSLYGIVFFSLLTLLTHNVAIWFILSLNLVFFMLTRDRKLIPKWIFAQFILITVYSPWLWIFFKQVYSQSTVLDWFVPYWHTKNVFMHFMDSIFIFSFGPFPPYLAIQNVVMGTGIISILFILLIGFGLYQLTISGALSYILFSSLFTILLALIYSSWIQPVYIPGRTDHYLLPFFLVLVAFGIQKINGQGMKILIILTYAGLALYTLTSYYKNTEKDFSKTYLESLHKMIGKGDVVITTGLTYAVTEYYLKKWKVPVYLDSFPLSAKMHPGYLGINALKEQPGVLEQDSEELIRKYGRTLNTKNKVFLLYVPESINSVLISKLNEKFIVAANTKEQNYKQSLLNNPVRIMVWEKP